MNPPSPIRVFVDAHVFDQEYQGSRTFLKEIYSILSQKENLHLYLAAFDIKNLQSIFPPAGNITYLPYPRRSKWPRLLFNIPSLLSHHGIDFAHFQYMIPPVKKCKYIVTIHDVIFEEYPKEFSFRYRLSKKLLFRMGASNADIITTVSAYSKNSIEKFLAAPADRIHVIPNAVNEIFFAPYAKERSVEFISRKYGIGPFILYVSRFEPRKNHSGLLKVYLDLELHRKGFYLVLLGHRSLKVDAFDQLVEGLPAEIRKFIFISDKINDEELLEFYRAAFLFVYPSKAEGFGISPLEAAALKIPVICSNTSAMQEFTFLGTGHVDTSDNNVLQNKIVRMLEQPPGPAMLQSISDTIRQKYSWKDSAEKFYRLLMQEKILSSSPKQLAK